MRIKGTFLVNIFNDMKFWQIFEQIYVFARIFAIQEQLRAAERKN